MTPKPNFFLVGAPRCGTTALYEYLRAHPDIFMPFFKEPNYFGSDLTGPKMEEFRGKPKKYVGLFKPATTQKRIGEASQWYLYSKRAAQEIHDFAPDARIIAMLRAPADMMHSCYFQWLYTGNEVLPTFEEALEAEADRKQGRRIPRMAHTLHAFYYSELPRYTEQLKRYFDVFGRDQVHVIIYDDFKKDTAGVYHDTLDFLGVDPTFETDFRVVNANKVVRHGALRRALMAIGISPMLLKDQITYLATTFPFLPPALRRAMLANPVSVYTKYTARHELSPELRERINAQFLPEVEQLSELLGLDLTHWCRAATPAVEAAASGS